MTKAQLREAYVEWNKAITIELHDRCSEIFKQLQELNAEYGDGHRWCSITENVKHLIGTTKEMKAFDLMKEYNEINGKWEALVDLAVATKNFEI